MVSDTVDGVVDALFENPRLAAVYDALDGDRRDLDLYLGLIDEFGARVVLDVGCGTGTFALLLAECGLTVTAVDPAGASLRVARAKPGASRVRWVHGVAAELPPLQADLATMTANVAQAIVGPADWAATLHAIYRSLRPGAHLAFETRNPADQGWRRWNRADTYRSTAVEGLGVVEAWEEVTHVRGPLVTFVSTRAFAADGAILTSESTLRFRGREEVEAALVEHGYIVDGVREAPDRHGRELVFIAHRPAR